MRILTVRQPWAWAIIHGGKTVENRTRNLAGAYRGPVAIHAGLQFDYAGLGAPNIARAITPDTLVNDVCLTGHIIGVVDLVDVHWSGMECSRGVTCHEYELCSPWAEAYTHHLMLSNPRPLAEPIPYKGALGLREIPTDIATLILAAVTA